MVQAVCPWRITPFLATVSIGAFTTVEAGLIGIEVAAVNASFDLVCQRYKAVQLIIGTQSVRADEKLLENLKNLLQQIKDSHIANKPTNEKKMTDKLKERLAKIDQAELFAYIEQLKSKQN